MSHSGALDRIAGSIRLGSLADDTLDALRRAKGGALESEDRAALKEARAFLIDAEKGFDVVDRTLHLDQGIARAVDYARSFRSAQETIVQLRAEEDVDSVENIRDTFRELIDSLDAIVARRKPDAEGLKLALRFFDVLASVTLSQTSESLRTQAEQRYYEVGSCSRMLLSS